MKLSQILSWIKTLEATLTSICWRPNLWRLSNVIVLCLTKMIGWHQQSVGSEVKQPLYVTQIVSSSLWKTKKKKKMIGRLLKGKEKVRTAEPSNKTHNSTKTLLNWTICSSSYHGHNQYFYAYYRKGQNPIACVQPEITKKTA